MISIILNKLSKKMGAGREAIVNYLISTGWKVAKPVANNTEDAEIEAAKNNTKILLLVRVAIAPEEPISLKEKQEKEIKERASKIDAKAYEAIVLLDKELQPKKINFKKLN